LRPEQKAFARKRADITASQLTDPSKIQLRDVIHNARPTVLIGVSGQPGTFTEEAVREMAAYTERPIIFPLSNPTSRSEATPQQLLDGTQGRALIGTGSPFEPVKVNGNSSPSIRQTTRTSSPGWHSASFPRAQSTSPMRSSRRLQKLWQNYHRRGNTSKRPCYLRSRRPALSVSTSPSQWAHKQFKMGWAR